LENSTITLLIRNFDVLATTVIGFFAVYGVITIFGKKLSINIFRGKAFAQAYCAASLIAFALEATVFNFPHYLKYFSDGECYITEVSLKDSTTLLTSDGTLAELIFPDKDTTEKINLTEDSLIAKTTIAEDNGAAVTALAIITLTKEGGEKDSAKDSTRLPIGVAFKNLDRRITSLYVKPVFDSTADSKNIIFRWTDEAGSLGRNMTIYKGLPFTNHIPFNLCGKTSEFKVYFSGDISEVALNRQIPFYFSGLRLFVLSCLLFVVIVFVRKRLRTKAAYFIFEYRFNTSSKKQNLVYTFSVALLLFFAWFCAFTSETKGSQEFPLYRQYNEYLVDALLAGRTHLEFGNPKKLSDAERPYDIRWLEANGYKPAVDWVGDWVWYKGKFYCYFGIVPAVILYVPYKAFTDNYLSNHAGIFLFMAVAVIFMALLWRHFTEKYMSNARFAFYLLSFFALFFAGGLVGPLRFLKFYSIVSAAGFMFIIAGIFLLLKSIENEKTKLKTLFFACLCFALAVGCRPNLVFVSRMVPALLWKRRSWKLLALLAVPYIMVAIPLCYYNYIRFGSILDFGFNYNLTTLNTSALSLMDPIGKVIRTFVSLMSYLFSVNTYSITFPYVDCVPHHTWFKYVVAHFHDKTSGMINFPIIFCLFYFVKSIFAKRKPDTFLMSSIFLIIAAIIIFLDSFLVGISGRYIIDFAIFILIPSIFCAYHLCDEQVCDYRKVFRLKAVYVMLIFSILVGLALFATSITNDATFGDPALYRYLQVSLGIPGTV
jgi:hypothetical protein